MTPLDEMHEALNPDTSKASLEVLCQHYPSLVLANPVTLLYLLEDPSWWVPAACLRRIAVATLRAARPDLPPWISQDSIPRSFGLPPDPYRVEGHGQGNGHYGYTGLGYVGSGVGNGRAYGHGEDDGHGFGEKNLFDCEALPDHVGSCFMPFSNR